MVSPLIDTERPNRSPLEPSLAVSQYEDGEGVPATGPPKTFSRPDKKKAMTNPEIRPRLPIFTAPVYRVARLFIKRGMKEERRHYLSKNRVRLIQRPHSMDESAGRLFQLVGDIPERMVLS
jgi:hypothetical protein